MGISSPMHNRCEWRHSRVSYLMIVVIVGSLSLTAFHHFEYKYGYASMCNGTLTYAKLVPIERTPSTVPFILELISPIMTPSQRDGIRRLMPELGPIVHGWLLTGKVMNFVLFCMSSVYFRRRLRAIIMNRCGCDSHLKKYSGMSSGYSARWQAVRMNTLIYRESAVRQSSYLTQLE
ncbi:hypothetical protein OESDEN_05600 [Oesophagostomum dentatum]|uniref:G-protein coupled receptors family 1 profile domain-containing protein n=1 Tax=Oesophagostomum dentatum TaxID=61180 RepID=A0A0B1TB32_OESDE|nr:hypothetical protein OESDEN_05600 [Oesophagostomum dentatum]